MDRCSCNIIKNVISVVRKRRNSRKPSNCNYLATLRGLWSPKMGQAVDVTEFMNAESPGFSFPNVNPQTKVPLKYLGNYSNLYTFLRDGIFYRN